MQNADNKKPRQSGGCFFGFPKGKISFIKNNLGALHRIFFMIKLNLREMKKLSRILTAFICCTPFGLAYGSTVATTSGSNLTAFNPSTANNNQWATLSNGRSDAVGKSAKADFGNCNSVVLRCAQPKCGNGGCADSNIASSIVAGCVKTNENCKQYGDDLIDFMTAQLVASANVKINQQNLAAQQAAAAAASEQSQQQMAAMQQQMQQMQQQMQQQQAESAQQLQAALAAQQEQSQKALEEMKTAATNAAMENEAGISAYQQDAINRGIGLEVLERQKITGQIMTEIEDAEVSIKAMKTAMQNSFEYAHCDVHGNNCEGPKRVKKWRELARDFIEPYDNSIDKMYNALETAQTVGVDLSQIYMMLNDACNSWGQYMCPNMGDNTDTYIVYNYNQNTSKSSPKVCLKSAENLQITCSVQCTEAPLKDPDEKCVNDCLLRYGCQPCTLLKTLTDADSVYEGWVNAETGTKDGNTTVVACASGALDGSKLFAGRARRKKGGNLVDVEILDMWLSQVEPSVNRQGGLSGKDYCYNDNSQMWLQKAISKKSVASTGVDGLCYELTSSGSAVTSVKNIDDCGLINPAYAICDTHPYNAGLDNASAERDNNCTAFAKNIDSKVDIAIKKSNGIDTCKNNYKILLCKDDDGYLRPDTDGQKCSLDPMSESGVKEAQAEYARDLVSDNVHEMLGLKTTVISQQMYKQYEYINATLRRLKTQLQKAVLTSTLEAAGAKSEDGSGSSAKSLLGGSGTGGNNDKKIYLPGAENCGNNMDSKTGYKCLQNNIQIIISNARTNTTKARKQLDETLQWAKNWEVNTDDICDKKSSKDDIESCAQALNQRIAKAKRKEELEDRKYGAMRYASDD